LYIGQASKILRSKTYLDRLSLALILIILVLASFNFAVPVFANTPEIRNVAVTKIGTRYHLDITIYHTVENSTHYVITIRVLINGYDNVTDVTLVPQTLSLDYTFTVPYDLGVLQGGSAYVDVYARCTQDSWSDPWSGVVPELSLPIMLIGLILATSLAVFALRRAKLISSK